MHATTPWYLLPQFRPARLQDCVFWLEADSFNGGIWRNLAPNYSYTNHGTANGGVGLNTWHPKYSPCPRFYGEDEHFRVSYHPSLDFWYEPFSIEVVMKTAYKANYQGIVFHYHGKGYVLLTLKDTGKVKFTITTSGVESNSVVCDGELHHIIATRGPAPDYDVKIYIDRELDATGTNDQRATPNYDVDVGIGMYIEPNFGNYPFHGLIYLVRIYKDALTPAEVHHNFTHHPLYYLQRGIDPYEVFTAATAAAAPSI